MQIAHGLVSSTVVAVLLLAGGPARATITVFPKHGASSDWTGAPLGPGVIVMGGNQDVDEAFRWMQARLAGAGNSGGDVVVLRDPDSNVGHDDDYAPYLLSLAKFNSVQTVVLADPVTTAELAQAAAIVDGAEGVFFGGGDQRHYVGWRGPLLDAVQRVYDRRGVVGGTSAGGALWGQVVNDAIGEYRHGSTTSANAVANPFEPSITFTTGLFAIPTLAGVITDSHFHARDRFGRLGAFVARIAGGGLAGGSTATGLGVDEDSALLVDEHGVAMLALYAPGRGGAWIVHGGPPPVLVPGRPLAYEVAVTRLDAVGQRFDLARGCGDGASYTIAIDGAKTPAYAPADPYGAPGAGPATCGPAADAGWPPAPGGDAAAPPAPPDAAAGPDGRAPDGAPSDDAPADGVLPARGCACATSPSGGAEGAWLVMCALGAAGLRRNKCFRNARRSVIRVSSRGPA